MARLTLRQRLIAIAVGGLVAIVEAYVPAHKVVRSASNAPATSCSAKTAARC